MICEFYQNKLIKKLKAGPLAAAELNRLGQHCARCEHMERYGTGNFYWCRKRHMDVTPKRWNFGRRTV